MLSFIWVKKHVIPTNPRIARGSRSDTGQMGKILSCSQRVYSNYERGELDIPTEILIKLADFYEVSVDYLLNRTEQMQMTK